MTRIAYIEKRFRAETLETIEVADDIIEEYLEQGFKLTLRQLYYQFVARGHLDNTQREYDRLGSIISDARLAGEIDWEAIEDRTRSLKQMSHWDSPQAVIQACAEQYKVDKWVGQVVRPEVWIEKDALVGVIEGICRSLDVAFLSNRGYLSQSIMWEAAQRFRVHHFDSQQATLVIHMGDHDPSGIDMTRDIQTRLDLFDSGARVLRIALTQKQVEQYNPPPNPTKITDSRAKGYIERFGNSSWELDALEPGVMAALIQRAVEAVRDDVVWAERVALEEKQRQELVDAAEDWDGLFGERRGY